MGGGVLGISMHCMVNHLGQLQNARLAGFGGTGFNLWPFSILSEIQYPQVEACATNPVQLEEGRFGLARNALRCYKITPLSL